MISRRRSVIAALLGCGGVLALVAVGYSAAGGVSMAAASTTAQGAARVPAVEAQMLAAVDVRLRGSQPAEESGVASARSAVPVERPASNPVPVHLVGGFAAGRDPMRDMADLSGKGFALSRQAAEYLNLPLAGAETAPFRQQEITLAAPDAGVRPFWRILGKNDGVQPKVTLLSMKPSQRVDDGVSSPLSPGAGPNDGAARPLKLPPVAHTKAQICMATAIYFEAGRESREGQVAVAQVIINRVRSASYPNTVCDVVYQGLDKHRYGGGCQFSFVCDGTSIRIPRNRIWAQAMEVAGRVISGEEWNAQIGNSTHYHADYVRPAWIRDMVTKGQIGRHIFYRVRNWS